MDLQINFTTGESQGASMIAKWILTHITKKAARKKNSKLKEFFKRKKKLIGHAKAIFAKARGIATII